MSTAVCTRLNEIHSESLLNDHDTFLFDCDGVLCCSPSILPGAIELLNYLTTLVWNYLSKDIIFYFILRGNECFL
jgi:hypothetical protein